MAAEKTFENKIKAFLTEHGCWFIKYWSGGSMQGKKFTKDGIPDLLCCINGQFFGIEVKASNGRPKPLQLYNLRKIHDAGGFGVLLYPNMWDEFKEFLKNPTQSDDWYMKNKKFQDDWNERLKKEGDV